MNNVISSCWTWTCC